LQKGGNLVKRLTYFKNCSISMIYGYL